jgi:hypothetical protein
MPTARPSITPNTGVTEMNSTRLENDRAASDATPMPSTALTSGTAAPTIVRSIRKSTIAATMTPAISPGPRMDGTPWAMSFDTYTRTPSIFAASALSEIAVLVLCGTS